MSKNKVHTIYKNKDGKRVVGVTTPLGILAKPALIYWAWDLGCKGIDFRKFRDDKADIGTLVHYLILCDLKNIESDTSDYSAKQIDQAENSMLSYYSWIKGKSIKPIAIEVPMISEKYQYGGTPDLFAEIDGQSSLVDFKTGKGIYDEAVFQVAAYKQLISENFDCCPDNIKILKFGRDESEGFEEKPVTHLMGLGFEIFLSCLHIYNLQKQVKKAKK